MGTVPSVCLGGALDSDCCDGGHRNSRVRCIKPARQQGLWEGSQLHSVIEVD